VRTLSAALAAAVDAGKLPSNPAAGIARLTTDTIRRDALSAEQAEMIRAALPTQRDRVLWELLFMAGLRTEKAPALRWRDLRDLSATGGRVAVDRVSVAGEIRQRPKTGAGRDVQIIGPLADDLLALRDSIEYDPDALVCPSRAGTPVLPRQLARSRLATRRGCARALLVDAVYRPAHPYQSDDPRPGVARDRGGVGGAHLRRDDLEALRAHVRRRTDRSGGPAGPRRPGRPSRGAPKWSSRGLPTRQRD